MSGINGFRGVDSFEAAGADGAVEDGAADAPPVEGQIVRGETSALAQSVTDMGATVLQARLQDAGATTSEAAAQASEITKTAEEIQALEEELAFLQELEAMYEDWLADPETDFWDSMWIESDLWDVRLDMYDIEYELGRLTEDFDHLVSNAWDELLGVVKDTCTFLESETDAMARREANRLEESAIDRKIRERHGKNVDARFEDKMRELQEKGYVVPVPPQSDQAKKIVEDLRKSLDVAGEFRTKERLGEILDGLRERRQGGRLA